MPSTIRKPHPALAATSPTHRLESTPIPQAAIGSHRPKPHSIALKQRGKPPDCAARECRHVEITIHPLRYLPFAGSARGPPQDESACEEVPRSPATPARETAASGHPCRLRITGPSVPKSKTQSLASHRQKEISPGNRSLFCYLPFAASASDLVRQRLRQEAADQTQAGASPPDRHTATSNPLKKLPLYDLTPAGDSARACPFGRFRLFNGLLALSQYLRIADSATHPDRMSIRRIPPPTRVWPVQMEASCRPKWIVVGQVKGAHKNKETRATKSATGCRPVSLLRYANSHVTADRAFETN